MREPHERLQHARKSAGYADATAAAEAFGFNVNTYRSHENGTRGMKTQVAKRYAKAFHVTSSWILTGEGDADLHPDLITVSQSDLRSVVSLLLRAQGSPDELAAELADTVVACLSEPPLAAVERDVVRSFQVRLELQSRRYAAPNVQ